MSVRYVTMDRCQLTFVDCPRFGVLKIKECEGRGILVLLDKETRR